MSERIATLPLPGRDNHSAAARLRRGLARVPGRIVIYGLLIALSFLFALPFLWMLSSSLKDDPQTYTSPPIWIPIPAHFSNYPEALAARPFVQYLANTMTIALPSALGTVISCTLTAYSFSRIRWLGRDALFFICIATMMIPFQVRMIPLFLTFKELGWINTYLPLIVPSFFGNAYFIFMLRQFFMTVPQELSDAARVDGCSEFNIMWRIILPLAKPALAVVGLFQFMNDWSDYIGPLIYLNEESKYTIALGLQLFRSGFSAKLVWPYLMAASTTTIVPIIFLFFFTQRTFVEGITITGIKG